MKFFVLGCGTIVAENSGANCSGYLIDNQLLFDCGPGIWRAIHYYRKDLVKINYIFLSHFHLDHTSDLGPFLLNRYLLNGTAGKNLTIIGPPGLESWFKKMKALIGDWVDDLSLDLKEISANPMKIAVDMITTRPTGHTENSICFRVEKRGKTFFYSGDTDYNQNLISLAKSCHLAILEASNSADTKIDGHLTPQLAVKLASRAGVKKLVLTHMYPEAKQQDQFTFPDDDFKGEILIARDGMEISI